MIVLTSWKTSLLLIPKSDQLVVNNSKLSFKRNSLSKNRICIKFVIPDLIRNPVITTIQEIPAFAGRIYSLQLPHSRESGNPEKLFILQVLLDSRFHGNEEQGLAWTFSDRQVYQNDHC